MNLELEDPTFIGRKDDHSSAESHIGEQDTILMNIDSFFERPYI